MWDNEGVLVLGWGVEGVEVGGFVRVGNEVWMDMTFVWGRKKIGVKDILKNNLEHQDMQLQGKNAYNTSWHIYVL